MSALEASALEVVERTVCYDTDMLGRMIIMNDVIIFVGNLMIAIINSFIRKSLIISCRINQYQTEECCER